MDLAAAVAPSTLARQRTLPVADPLQPLFPDGALARGRTVACRGAAATSLAIALAAEATVAGAWLAVVDVPWPRWRSPSYPPAPDCAPPGDHVRAADGHGVVPGLADRRRRGGGGCARHRAPRQPGRGPVAGRRRRRGGRRPAPPSGPATLPRR